LVQYPIQDYILYGNITNEHYAFLNSISQANEPQTFEIAKHNSNWCKAMDEELHALEKNQT
jgi:hypothetical protein